MPIDQEIAALKSELEVRLELVNSDPEYEGEQARAGNQMLLACTCKMQAPAGGLDVNAGWGMLTRADHSACLRYA